MAAVFCFSVSLVKYNVKTKIGDLDLLFFLWFQWNLWYDRGFVLSYATLAILERLGVLLRLLCSPSFKPFHSAVVCLGLPLWPNRPCVGRAKVHSDYRLPIADYWLLKIFGKSQQKRPNFLAKTWKKVKEKKESFVPKIFPRQTIFMRKNPNFLHPT